MDDKTHVVEYDAECKSCKGTGLYVGFAEKDGASVVCSSCLGKGWIHITHTYRDFTGLKDREDVRWVYEHNPGICIGEGYLQQVLRRSVHAGPGFSLGSFGGMSIDSWKRGESFPKGAENRKCVCPAWWYQGANYELKPRWDACIGCGSFSACESFSEKDRCWERWDKEFGDA